MAIARIIPRSVLADQVKERLLEGILNGHYATGLADRRDPGRPRARDQPGAGARGAARARGARRRRDHAVPRSAGSAARRAARSSRRTRSARRWRSLAARLAVPRLTDADVDGARRLSRGDAGGGARRRRSRRGRGRRPLPRPDRRAGRQRHARAGLAARSSRSRGPTSRSSFPARTRSGRPTSTRRSSAAIERRDTEAVVDALERHFDEVRDNMASRWPDDAPTPRPIHRTTRGTHDHDPATVRGAVGGPGAAPHRRARRRAARARPRRHELPQLPPRRRADLARGHASPSPTSSGSGTRDKGIAYDGRRMTFSGPWPAGPIQKVVVTMLALRMEAVGLHPFHASAVRYRDRDGPVPRRRVEPRQVDGPDRGLPARRAAGLDRDDRHRRDRRRRVGSKEPFLKKRTEGTERADKAAPERGVEKFFGTMPTLGAVHRAEQRRPRHRPRDRWQLRRLVAPR